MPSYAPPLRDMRFVVHELFDVVHELSELPPYADLDAETVDAVLEEAARFASEVVFPLNLRGDTQGCELDPLTRCVTLPEGFKQAYEQFVQGGWPTLGCDPQYGGQGLPQVMTQCLYEMLNAASQAWAMYPGLSHAAYETLHAHGTDWQKKTYLPRLVSGEWTGTMCLTESQCGSDLGLLRSRAEPQADGSYRITGEKIFISAGEHDLTDNIVHLVLARLPDAPPGTRGISLFAVPKFLIEADGTPGARNAVHCAALEHKMGIQGSATTQLVLEGAQGTLIGAPHKGLQAMFVMMNMARLGVGNQSVALAEVAFQNALAYAKERLQMRRLSGPQAAEKPADPIIVHPDVRRMLLTAKAWAEGGRALIAYTALWHEKALYHPDESERRISAQRVALLTPVTKAFLTDNGFSATVECQQVLGGHGYIRAWGMEQFVRDARINMIYEGTNTIQALDLLGRKVLGDQGAALKHLGQEIAAFIDSEGVNERMAPFINPLATLAGRVEALTAEIGLRSLQSADELGAAATPYLRIIGHVLFSYLFARMAQTALRILAAPDAQGWDQAFYQGKLQTARFYFAWLYPETAALFQQARVGSPVLLDTDAALA